MPKKLFTKENAREAQAKGVLKRKANKELPKEPVKDYINKDLVELVFVTPYDEAVKRLKNPKHICDYIVAQQIANKKQSWQFFNDICDRVIGKPKVQADVNLDADLRVTLDTTGLYGEDEQ